MKRLIYHIFPLLLLLVACQDADETPLAAAGQGYLSLGGVELQEGERMQVGQTRAVPDDLNIDIVSAESGETVVSLAAGAAEIQQKIALTPGGYTLKSYTDSYREEATWSDSEKGTAVYYAETAFSIEDDRVTYLDVTVPMLNYGVSFTLPTGFDTYFTSYSFTVTAGSRSVTLTVSDSDTAYFNAAQTSFSYLFTATNKDGESFNLSGTYDNALPGMRYAVTYSIATRSLQLLSE
ncbi:MAG: DUF4493 domain-containing protein [Bacteroides sp.]|nr:DUF4493 domain-containing protein [Bacteroides sp.]